MGKEYEAVIIGVMFDERYDFEDIFMHGIAHSKEESFAIQQEEMMRLYEDYADENDDKYRVEYSEDRSVYDNPICVFKYKLGYEHMYCIFTNEGRSEQDKEMAAK